MGSGKAQIMARKVSEKVRQGQSFTFEKVALESGYSPSMAKSSTKIVRTKAYKAALIVENSPLIAGIQEEINAIKIAMAKKNKDNEEYRVLAGSLDLLTKNYQLLSGGATERQVFVLPSEVMGRNAIAPTEDKKLLDNGSTEP